MSGVARFVGFCVHVLPPLLLVALVVIASAQYAVARSIVLGLPAVNEEGEGVIIPARIYLYYPGSGIVDVKPSNLVASDTRDSVKVAYYYAAMSTEHNPLGYDLLVDFNTGLSVGGPSASGFIAAGTIMLFKGVEPPVNATMTGMLAPNGLLLPVAGIPAKVVAASRNGYELMVIPATAAVELPKENITIVRVCSVDDAVGVLGGLKPLTVNISVVLAKEVFGEIASRLVNDTRFFMGVAEEIAKELRPSQAKAVRKFIEYAERALEDHNYYSAASLAFVAAYNASKAYIEGGGGVEKLWQILGKPDKVRAKAAKHVEAARLKFEAAQHVGIWGFEALAMAEVRLYLSEALAESKKPLDQVVSVLRAYTAFSWAKLADPTLGPKVSHDVLEKAALASIAYAEAVKDYVLNYVPRFKVAGSVDPDKWLNEARRALAMGLYARAFGLSAMLVADATGVLSVVFKADQKTLYTCSARQVILNNVWLSHNLGSPSLVSILLYNYAQNYASKLLGRLIGISLLNEAASYALLDKLFTILSQAEIAKGPGLQPLSIDAVVRFTLAMLAIYAGVAYTAFIVALGRREKYSWEDLRG